MVQTIIHIALSNAAVATVLAVAALAVTIAFRRPALSHAAWMLVLLKLLTPPLFTVPIDLPRAAEDATGSAVATVHPPTDDVEAGLLPQEPLTYLSIEEPVAVQEAAPTAAPPPVLRPRPALAPLRSHWPVLLIATWATGSILVLALILARLLQFRRVLRCAVPAAGDVRDQVRYLCDDLDVRPVPSVWFVPGGVCPMLVGLGRGSRILVPRDLWGRLDERQRGTLLVHELAHLRRGDQWVRLVELLVTVLYWWHPVAWFARRELREAEEQCCDAWVVWAMPRSARDYAVALMEAIDMTTRARPIVRPVLGSGMGEFHHLRRRLIMIKQAKVARALTWSGFGAMCGVGAVLLPLSPTLAFDDTPVQETPAASAADPFSVVERLDEIDGVVVAVEAPPAAPAPPGADNFEYANDPNDPAAVQFQAQVNGQRIKAAEQAQRAEQQSLDAELQATREVIRSLSRELERAHARLAELEARRGGRRGGGGGGGSMRPGAMPDGMVMPPGRDPRITPPGGTPRMVQPVQPGNVPRAGSPRVETVPRAPTARRAPARAEGGQAERLEALEDRLADLLEEVRSLKRQRETDRQRDGYGASATTPPMMPMTPTLPPPAAPPAGEAAPARR